MRIVLLGAPGSGKGTQARLLSERYNAPQVSTGDLLREAVAAGSPPGKKAQAAMAAGELVPDTVVLDIVQQRLNKPDARKGFILDGFPRNIPQAQELDGRLHWVSRPLQVTLYVTVAAPVLIKRLSGRMTCGKCGAIYNEYFSPPGKAGVCDQCGARALTKRSDDNPETVRNRLGVYDRDTEPLIAYYRAQHKLRTVSGEGRVDEIFERICSAIDAEIHPLTVPVDLSLTGHGAGTAITGGKVVKTPVRETPGSGVMAVAARGHTGTGTAAAATGGKAGSKAGDKAGSKAGDKAGSKTESAGHVAKRTAKKPAAEKQPAARKKPVAKKKPAARKKPATKKKPAARKKPATRKVAKRIAKKPTSRKRPVAKKKPASRKKSATRKKPVTKKKPTARKKPVAKKKSAARKKPAARKVAKRTAKKPTSRKRPVAKKKPASRKKPTTRKRPATKKKPAARKKPVARKAAKRAAPRRTARKAAATRKGHRVPRARRRV